MKRFFLVALLLSLVACRPETPTFQSSQSPKNLIVLPPGEFVTDIKPIDSVSILVVTGTIEGFNGREYTHAYIIYRTNDIYVVTKEFHIKNNPNTK